MRKAGTKTAIELAAARLRTLAVESPDGALIGSEESLVALFGCSRGTIRQVARLLEREGMLRVRRGINGGYFAARPDAETIELAVSSYLQTIELDPSDIVKAAAALWIEAVRKAAETGGPETEKVVLFLRKKLKSVKDVASFSQIREAELIFQREIYNLTNSRYMRLLFDINTAFSGRNFPSPAISDETGPVQVQFVQSWRDAKLLELNAIMMRSGELADLAARCSRQTWLERISDQMAVDGAGGGEVPQG